ncbi:hypothetical protein JTE90_014682 [Oedothorax gibbosus]|uniref:Uncharacterized protein n=1 Tax=Oedothorax gibbosus TaxID=931172 RepID=A0AAV6TU38_9ARAC|nr:hypothetical protein JTE90_014682 [Oedothorax gibbosus]
MVIKIMAQNSDFEPGEIEILSESCPAAILNAIPSHCQKVLFSQLKAEDNYKDKAIVGKLCQINPLGKRATGFIRKLQITDGLYLVIFMY